jgi:serine/threonine protein kinase
MAEDLSMAVVPYAASREAAVAVRPSHSRCPLCLRDFDASGAAASPLRRSGARADGVVSPALLLDSNYFRSLPPGIAMRDLPLPAEPHKRSRASSASEDDASVDSAGDAGHADSTANVEDSLLHEAVDRTQGYYAQYFTELRCIGRGASGGVFLCRHTLDGIILGMFAVKKIPVGNDAAYLRRAIGEVQLLERIPRHPNIVEYHHTWFDYAQLADFGPEVRCLFVLLEYATEGSLSGYVEAHGSGLSNATVWYFFLSALAGTAHLHEHGVLHRDLKPENLLLTQIDPKLPPRLFVSDFGTAALVSESSFPGLSAGRTGGTGTEEYMAPELFELDPISRTYKNRHTEASDVWSLGLILHFLACDGVLPAVLPGSGGELVFNIEAHSPVQRPPEMIALVRAMLQRDPAKRPSCREILCSEYVVALVHEFQHHGMPSSPRRDEHAGSGVLPQPMPLLLKYRATSAGHRRARGAASPAPRAVPEKELAMVQCEVGTQTDSVRFAD